MHGNIQSRVSVMLSHEDSFLRTMRLELQDNTKARIGVCVLVFNLVPRLCPCKLEGAPLSINKGKYLGTRLAWVRFSNRLNPFMEVFNLRICCCKPYCLR